MQWWKQRVPNNQWLGRQPQGTPQKLKGHFKKKSVKKNETNWEGELKLSLSDFIIIAVGVRSKMGDYILTSLCLLTGGTLWFLVPV